MNLKQAPEDDEWNGEFLGKCDVNTNLIKSEKINKERILNLTVLNEWCCVAKQDRNSLLAVADECAHLFGFMKIGTTTINLRGFRYTCTRFSFSEMVPCNIQSIKIISIKRRIQDFVVFRWIFGVPINAKKDVFLFNGRICAPFTKPCEDPTCDSRFFEDTIEDSKKRLLKGRSLGSIIFEVQEVIKRINKESIQVYSGIRSRFSL